MSEEEKEKEDTTPKGEEDIDQMVNKDWKKMKKNVGKLTNTVMDTYDTLFGLY